MAFRKYFLTSKELEQITGVPDDTIRDMVRSGKIPGVKFGVFVLIPTISLRMMYRDQLPVEFWEELVEDLYKGLDGYESAKMRLDRIRHGKHPSTGKDTPQKPK